MGEEQEPHEFSSTLYPGRAQGQQEVAGAWTRSATGQLALQLRKAAGLRVSVSSCLNTAPKTARRSGSGLTHHYTAFVMERYLGCSALSLRFPSNRAGSVSLRQVHPQTHSAPELLSLQNEEIASLGERFSCWFC